MRVSIFVRFAFESIHSWPEVPLELMEQYLRHPHRHMFHVEGVMDVTHTDRDIEFIALRRDMASYCLARWGVNTTGPDGHGYSCEAIALHLVEQFNLRSCSVSEDNENGAIVSRT